MWCIVLGNVKSRIGETIRRLAHLKAELKLQSTKNGLRFLILKLGDY